MHFFQSITNSKLSLLNVPNLNTKLPHLHSIQVLVVISFQNLLVQVIPTFSVFSRDPTIHH
jgi:hypothetical protein